MRSMVWTDGAKARYDEAMTIISRISSVDLETGRKVRESYYQCIEVLTNILFNADLPLDEYGLEKGEAVMEITPDFVTGSFAFCLKRNGIAGLVGGMILHGFEPTFSTELAGPSHPHWSIHT